MHQNYVVVVVVVVVDLENFGIDIVSVHVVAVLAEIWAVWS